MIDFIFSGSSTWSWTTFFLYYFVSVVVVFFCKIGIGRTVYVGVDGTNSFMCNRKDGILPSFIAYVILVLLATLRSNMVGSDTWKYVDDFLFVDYQDLKEFDWKQLLLFHQTEPLYLLFVRFVRSFTDNYHILFLCLYSMVAASYILFIRHFLKKELNASFLKLFIVFYVGNMSGMRSALATIPLLLSFISLDNGHYKKAIVYSIVAFFCHYTMLYNIFIVLGVWLVKKVKSLQNSRWICFAFIGTFAISVVGASSLLGFFAETKYSFYTDTASEQSFLGSTIYVVFGLLLLLYFKTFNKIYSYQTLLYVCVLLLITYPLIYVTAAYRIPHYYALPRLIMWCAITTYLGYRYSRYKVMINIGCDLIVFAYMLLRFYKSALDGFFEYVIS